MLVQATRDDYNEIIEVWEASVRATHHFLPEEHIQYFKPLILNQYLDAVQLWCKKQEDKVVGFLGTSPEAIEMLFIHPDSFGKGFGKEMVNFAVEVLKVTKVDVNEQNDQAVRFYQHVGFTIVSRSETDGLGLPYPILHMELSKTI